MNRHLLVGGTAPIAAVALLAALVAATGIPTIAGLSLVVTATALMAALVLGSVARRINGLRKTAARVAAGEFEARFDGAGEDEIGLLESELNRLADRARAASTDLGQGTSRLLAVLNSSADPIVAVGREGKIALANAAAEKMFGGNRDQLIGSALTWVLPQESIDLALRNAINAGLSSTVALDVPPGYHLQVSVTPIVGGGDWLVLAVFRDQTEIQRTEKMRRDFIANVSHELRTPIASIKAVVETLEAGAMHDEARATEFLGRAEHEVDRLAGLVEQLLQLSRLESGDLPLKDEEVDAAAIAESVVQRLRPVADQRGIHLNYSSGEGVSGTRGDSSLIERALTNIVQNALKFTPVEGSVLVSVERTGSEVILAVADSGIGIEADDLPRIFERFYKVDAARGQPGTGLGLAIAKHAIESNGGRIEVESIYGRGTTFRVVVPIRSNEG